MVPGEVVKLFLATDVYANMAVRDVNDRIYRANAVGHLVVEDGLAFTWSRPDDMVTLTKAMEGDVLEVHEYRSDPCSTVWILDMAARPGWTGVQVGRALSRLLVQQGIAKIGEMCIYRRNGGATPYRYGRAIIKG